MIFMYTIMTKLERSRNHQKAKIMLDISLVKVYNLVTLAGYLAY